MQVQSLFPVGLSIAAVVDVEHWLERIQWPFVGHLEGQVVT